MDKDNIYTEKQINLAINKAIEKCEKCEKEAAEAAQKKSPSSSGGFMIGILGVINRTQLADYICKELGFQFDPRIMEEED